MREDGQTRPILLIDTDHRQLYVFTSTESGGNIYYKTTSLDNIVFSDGPGAVFMSKPGFAINNVTSTKQAITTASGIVVLASHDNVASGVDTPQADYYFHNYINLGGPVIIPTNTTLPSTTKTPAPTTPTAVPTIGPGDAPKPRVYISVVIR
jgi:hypothetical protein